MPSCISRLTARSTYPVRLLDRLFFRSWTQTSTIIYRPFYTASVICCILSIKLTPILYFRYKAVKYPLQQQTSRKTAKILLTIIWISSILVAIPMSLFHEFRYIGDKTMGIKPFCTPYATVKTVLKTDSNHTLYRMKVTEQSIISIYIDYDQFLFILFLLQYVLPVALLVIGYAHMSLTLWSRNPPGRFWPKCWKEGRLWGGAHNCSVGKHDSLHSVFTHILAKLHITQTEKRRCDLKYRFNQNKPSGV